MKTNKFFNNLPLFTLAVAFVSVFLFVFMAILSDSLQIKYTYFEKFGAPYAIQIYEGQYWGLVANSFIHAFPLHLIANLIGLLFFGSLVEKRIGWFQLFLFGLFASIFTSLNQLALSNDAGLGLSAVNYALFGFIFVRVLKDEQFQLRYHLPVSLFMIGFVCFSFVMNFTSSWFIGVEGQLSGLFFGAISAIAYNWKWNWKAWIIVTLPFVLALSTLFFAPWSSMWQCSKGIELHEKREIEKAIPFYQEALEIEPTNKIALRNLQQIQIDEWAVLAYNAHKQGKFTDAYRYYLRILSLDKNNAWARGNLNALP